MARSAKPVIAGSNPALPSIALPLNQLFMKSVYKYQGKAVGTGHGFSDHVILEMPASAEIIQADISVREGVEITVWAVVDKDALKVQRSFRVAGTGHDLDYPEGTHIKHIVTVFERVFVWHLFELLNFNTLKTDS
jgi:hypothetical protein